MYAKQRISQSMRVGFRDNLLLLCRTGNSDLFKKLPSQEKAIIEAALSESGGRVYGPSGAAAKLGIPRSTLEHKIRSLKINKNRFKTAAIPSRERLELSHSIWIVRAKSLYKFRPIGQLRPICCRIDAISIIVNNLRLALGLHLRSAS